MQNVFVNVGSGDKKIQGFINLDINRDLNVDLIADMRQGLPFQKNSVNGIFSEHFIEHLTQEEGISFLRECRRVLAFRGLLRIATPDLDFIVQRYLRKDWRENGDMFQHGYDWVNNPCEQINLAMREWGHQWLYNEEELVRLADYVGLSFVKRYNLGESDEPMFCGLEYRKGSRLIIEFVKESVQNEKEHLVSVLIPAYNPRYFREALESAINQTYLHLEIIVCDDSPENTIEGIVNEFALSDRRIKYIKNEKNLGGRKNYLKLFGLANGEYIKFLNDDDILEKNCVERMVESLSEHPDVTLVTSHRQCIDADGDFLPDIVATKRPVLHDTLIDGISLANNMLAVEINFIGEPSTVMFRKRDLIDSRPHIMSLAGRPCIANGDVTMWCNLLSKGDAIYLVDTLSYFRLHEEQRQREKEFEEKAPLAWQQLKFDARRMGFLRTKGAALVQLHDNIRRTRCSIIIPVFNKVDFTRKCLEALYINTPAGIGFEVIVVDNASTDGTSRYLEEALKQYPGLRVLSNSENLGFARSCNQGARAASSKYLLFLNNDTEVKGGWIEPLMSVLDSDPTVVAVGSKMLFPDNTIQHAGVIILHDKRLPNPLGAMHVHSKQASDFALANQLCSYQALTAACMLVRRSVFESVGGYDEGYWNGFEDVDLCFKFQEQGGMLVYQPKSVVIHYESQSGPERFKSHDENINRLNQKWLGKVTEDLVIEENGKLTPNKTGRIRQYIIPASSGKVETKKSIVSIIIPVFNQLEFTKQCLESIKNNTPGVNYEIIVVDNGSNDGTTEYFKRIRNDVKIIKNEKNLGFAKACNQGALAAQSQYILFLNNDIKVISGWLEPLISILDEDPDVAAVGSKLLFPDGTIQHAGVIIIDDRKLPDPLVGRHIHYRKKPDSPEANQRLVYQALTAACLLVRRSVFQDVGGFDEGYWNGYEDVDLCFKLVENGWFLVYEPQSSAVHYESQSGPERFRQVSGNIERLHQKWLGKIMPDIVIEEDGKLRDSGAGKIAPYGIAKSTDPQSKKLEIIQNEFTSIIILTLNQLEYTKKCLDSIFRYTKQSFELIIVDNGSTDGTVAYLEKLQDRYDSNPDKKMADVTTPKKRKKKGQKKKARKSNALNHVCRAVKVIKNDENLGFAAGNNQGISAAQGNFILLMNNDVVVTPGWLERLIACAERKPEIGIVGPMTNYVPGQQLVKDVKYDTTSLARLNKFSKEYSGKYSGQGSLVLRVVGFCMLIKRAVIEKIGGLDDRYGLGNFEDDDFSLRAILGGFESWIAEDCFIHHFGNRTFIGSGIDYKESLNKNWEIFKKKWGMPPDLPYGSYNLSQIERKSFDPEKDYVPIDDNGIAEVGKDKAENVSVLREDSLIAEIPTKKMKNAVSASIIIFLSSQQKYTKRCIESIAMHSDEFHEIIFIDKGASKGALSWLRPMVHEKADYHLIKINGDTGLPKAYNEGIRASTGEYIVFLHDDVVVSGGWLSAMTECVESRSDIGIVGAMTNNVDGVQKDYGADYSSIVHFDDYAEKFRERNRYRHVPTKNVSGFCLLCRQGVIEKIGLFDEGIHSETFMFKDFCLRSELEGYKNIIAADVFVHHHDTHKMMKEGLNGQGVETKDRKFFVEKWETIRKVASRDNLGKRLRYLDTIEKAVELDQRDKINDAFNLLLEAIPHFSEHEGIYYALSDILMNNKQFKDALDVLNEIPSDGQVVKKLELEGYCQEGMEAYDQAEESANRVLAINPASAPALNLKGVLGYRRGDEKTAEDFFKKAIDSDPSYGEPYANLGFMKWSAKLESQALDLFEKGFILTPTVTDIFTNYHAAVKALGKYERAEQYFQDACNLYPKNKRLKYLLIDILLQREKHAMAMVEIQKAMVEFGMDEGMIAAALEVRNKLGPRQVESLSKNGSLSLCMIVKNEAHHLGQCLMNLNPVVDEVIVVDTGSSDMTKEIAAVFGAKVYDFEWSNDFSEARNYSLSKATGDWILVMDADEVISPVDYSALRKLIKKSASRSVSYSFVTRNYNMRTDIIGLNANDGTYDDEEAGVGWVSSEKVRLFRNDGKIRFQYPVHEMVEPFLRHSGIEICKCSIPIHHYGQLDQDTRTGKGEEYYHMGMRKLHEMGDDPNAIYELAVQAGMLERWEEAIELWQKLVSIRPKVPAAFVNMGTAFQKMGRYTEAIQSAKQAMELDPDMKEAPNDYALYNLYQGHAEQAVPVLEDLVKKYPDYLSARFKLAAAYTCVGRKKEGMDVLKKLSATAMGPGLAVSCHTLAKKLVSLKRNAYATAVLESAVESRNVNKEVISLLNECREEPLEKFIGISEAPGMPEAISSA